MDIVNLAPSALKPYAKNAKKHPPEQIDRIAASIEQFGFVQPVVIDKDNVIVIGHGRVVAAKKLGMREVPCVLVDTLTPEQVNALRLADNKTNESAWDIDLLSDGLLDVGGIDMTAFGFSAELIEQCDVAFESFDGKGDGGGSYIANGNKVRVVIGALMFDIEDETHTLYARTVGAVEDKVRAQIEMLIASGDLL